MSVVDFPSPDIVTAYPTHVRQMRALWLNGLNTYDIALTMNDRAGFPLYHEADVYRWIERLK